MNGPDGTPLRSGALHLTEPGDHEPAAGHRDPIEAAAISRDLAACWQQTMGARLARERGDEPRAEADRQTKQVRLAVSLPLGYDPPKPPQPPQA